jgi:hypothetical protein
MAGEQRGMHAKKTVEDTAVRTGAVRGAEAADPTGTPETCRLQLECPVCGWKAEGVRCVRCGALKISACGGSCAGCSGCATSG